jgi:hypothetical protein
MKHKSEDGIKQQLEEEASSISFTEDMREAVLAKAAKPIPFWNREITLRLPKSAAAFVLIIMIGATALFSAGSWNGTEHQETEERFITLSTGLYSESQLRELSRRQ